jgi:branched-chain amino acid transport system ATP-binding protein
VSVLTVTDLAKAFGGVRAVDGVSFSVEAGERVALIGPNGAGKTTLFNSINGQIRPDAGVVKILGVETTGLAPNQVWRHGVGRTFQITATFISMTVRENVQVALASYHRSATGVGRVLRHRFMEESQTLIQQVGLGDAATRPVSELAYGDLKRLELAVALTNAPKLLLMDEPTAGMAGDGRDEMMDLVDRLVTDVGISVLFTEHDMDVVFGHADRVVVLDRGRIITSGEPDAIRADEKVRAVYLGAYDDDGGTI